MWGEKYQLRETMLPSFLPRSLAQKVLLPTLILVPLGLLLKQVSENKLSKDRFRKEN